MTVYNNSQISKEIRKIINEYFKQGYEIKLDESKYPHAFSVQLFKDEETIEIIVYYSNTYVENTFMKKISIEERDSQKKYTVLRDFYSLDNVHDWLFYKKEPKKWTNNPEQAVEAEMIRRKRRIQRIKNEDKKLTKITKNLLKLIRKHKGFSNVKAEELNIERKPDYYVITKKNPKRAGQFININLVNKEEKAK